MSLIGTGDVRAYLNLPDEDKKPNTKLATLIDAVEDFAEGYCGRPFEAKLYKTDPSYCYFDGTGMAFFHLPVTPVWYVNEVSIDADRIFTGSGTLVATTDIILYEKEGKIVSDESYFSYGKRNLRIEYYAGYGTGTHASHDGQGYIGFAVPYDLKQTMIEMVIAAFNEGITGVHTVLNTNSVTGQVEGKFVNMLNKNSFWKQTLDGYKRYDSMVSPGYHV